jgi:hypothetical protein
VLAEYYEARRWTFPAFRHAVQTLSLTGRPSTVAFTGWMFGRNIRVERPSTRRRWALRPSRATWLPKLGSLPHTSQRLDISILLEKVRDRTPTAHRDVDREGRSAAAEAVVGGMGNKDRIQRAASGNRPLSPA